MKLEHIENFDPQIAQAIYDEVERQRSKIELIASENFVSKAVLEALGTPLTNKYAEGYPGKRYYGGCEYVDVVERLAIERAKELFGAEHVNVQPHSGAQPIWRYSLPCSTRETLLWAWICRMVGI